MKQLLETLISEHVGEFGWTTWVETQLVRQHQVNQVTERLLHGRGPWDLSQPLPALGPALPKLFLRSRSWRKRTASVPSAEVDDMGLTDTGRSRSQPWGHMLQRTLERATERVAMVRLVLSFIILASCLCCFPVPFPTAKHPCRLCRHLAWDSTSILAPGLQSFSQWEENHLPRAIQPTQMPGQALSEHACLFPLTAEIV